jgi:hypothetical protein
VQSTISKFDSKLPFYVLNLDIFENDMSRFVLKSSFKTDTFAVLYKYITKKIVVKIAFWGPCPCPNHL